MSPKVYQILRRRDEIATHQKILADLESSLTDEERKELAESEKAAKTPAPK